QLVDEGADKFIAPFDALLAGLAARRSEFAGEDGRFLLSGAARNALSASLVEALTEARFTRRLLAGDPSLWAEDPDDQGAVRERLGWLDAPRRSTDQLAAYEGLAAHVVAEGIRHVVVLGMGGSGLGAAVAAQTFGAAAGFPGLIVLDDIDPGAVRDLEALLDIERTLFVVASKSGTTVETLSLYRYFRARVAAAGVEHPDSRFVALTDPGSELAGEARERGFREVIETPADIGGRFSVLAPFGIVPMVLAGLDAAGVLQAASRQRAASGPEGPVDSNPSIGLGVALGTLARQGRTRLTVFTSPSIRRLEQWLEQLVAESTGKQGVGIVPIVGEPLRPVEEYGDDRVFVQISLDGEPDPEVDATLASLEDAGHPIIRLRVPNSAAIGAEFYRWELAVAAAAALLGVNPFDEPDVADAKRRARQQLEALATGHAATSADPVAAGHGLELYADTDDQAAAAGIEQRIRSWVDATPSGDYVAILAYFGASPARDRLASRLRDALGRRTGAATTFGYGPRYLHSTGQLHKGGMPDASILLLTADEPEDLEVPGEVYGLAQLRLAQAMGDAEALRDRGRRVIRVNLGWYVDEALDTLCRLLAAPLSPTG
ncbi:MAG: transaldolase, partial [Gemmatimonadota bacterium]|nr:transaldolase [Gemmatimonadota bacterium]